MFNIEIARAIGLIVAGLIGLAFLILWLMAMIRNIKASESPHVRFDPFEPTEFGAGWLSIVFLPGVQSRGNEALLPVSWSSTDPDGVMGLLRTRGRVITATYVREKFFSRSKVTAETVATVQSELNQGRTVLILGSSFGGMLAMDVQAQINPEQRPDVHCALISTPPNSGYLHSRAGRVVGAVLRWTYLDKLLQPLLALFSVGAGTIPVETIQAGLDTHEVQSSGRARSSGFSVSGFLSEMGLMGRWEFPDDDPMGQVYYVACMEDGVVQQPQGVKGWEFAYHGLVVHEVPISHCPYLEQPALMSKVFEDIIADL